MSAAQAPSSPSNPYLPRELLPTSHDLLERVRDPSAHDSWQKFYELYWRLIYRAAVLAGLSEFEAKDVLQQTMISVSRRMASFRYEPERCSFKGWLMHVTGGTSKIPCAGAEPKRAGLNPWTRRRLGRWRKSLMRQPKEGSRQRGPKNGRTTW